ncbi:hypothetical protein KC336_g22039, partial [Hortaea werneckii]
FGQRAAAWFDGCDIRVLEASLGFITASGRSSNDTSYYVINSTEYKNSGAGSEGTRASFASTLGEPMLINEVLGSDYESMAYVDTAYLV